MDSQIRELEREAARGSLEAGKQLALQHCRIGNHTWSHFYSAACWNNLLKWEIPEILEKIGVKRPAGSGGSGHLVRPGDKLWVRTCFFCHLSEHHLIFELDGKIERLIF